MKKFLVILLLLMMILSVFSGCLKNTGEIKSEDETEITDSDIKIKGEETGEDTKEEIAEKGELLLPFDDSLDFYFSSGAGAWGTELALKNDGSFKGGFHDSNMGEIGEENPYGTCYLCNFSGKFEIVEKINETAYRMKLSEIETEKEEGEEWIEDGVLYVVSTPYGLEGGTEFILYTPETKTDSVSEEFLWWWPERFSEEVPETLKLYGIHNVETNDGFFAYE